MRRYFILIVCILVMVTSACIVVSADVIPPDPLAGASTIVGEDYTPNYSEPVENEYFTGSLKTSSSCIEMLKALEGYLAKPAGDYQQYSIGYGCNTKYLRQYHEELDISEEDMEKVLSSSHSNYILKEEKAEALMMYVLVGIEEALDRFLEKYDISVNQYQYDALISFTYNLGKAWMNSTSRLGGVLVQGDYTVNEFASAMGVYCHVTVDGEAQVLDLLVTRRIREIKLFLYGAYELDDTPVKFCTLRYDAGDGDAATDIGFYQLDTPYQILFEAEPTAETEDFFIGWYTEDGEKVTAYDLAEKSKVVYARYSNIPEDPELTKDGEAYVSGEGPSVGQTDYIGSWTPVDVTAVFSDMEYDDWHYDYVSELYSRGVIDGFPDLTFRPENQVTTGQALKMILLAAGYEEPAPVASHWARNFLNLALEEGIIDRGEITDLDIPITRGLMAKIVVNSMKLSRLYDHSPFTDTTNVYVQTLYDFGLSDGYPDGTFLPKNHLKRSELCAIVCRMFDTRELYNLD